MEEEKELNRLVERGYKVAEMEKTDGWRKVVLPALQARAKLALDGFVRATSLADFLKHQSDMKSVNIILQTLENAVNDGKQAAEEIERRKEKDDDN